MEVILETRGVH